MTFWRQGSNDSLNDKLVRPRSSGSYWDSKSQSNAKEEAVETPLKDAQDVFSDVSEQISESAESALDDTKDEITKAVEQIFPEDLKTDDSTDLPDIPSDLPDLDAPTDTIQLEEADLDDVLAAPPVLEDLDELDDSLELEESLEDSDVTSIESLSFDQENEYSLENEDDTEKFTLGTPPPPPEDELIALEESESLNIPDIDVNDLETPTLETTDIEIPDLEEAELVSDASELGKMPPVLPVSGRGSGNTAHKLDQEEFRDNDTSVDTESDELVVPDARLDSDELDTKSSQNSPSEDKNGSGQVIAFPPSQGKSSQTDTQADDGLTEEERLAVSLSAGAGAAHSTTKNSPFNTRLAKPKNSGPIVTPRQTAATYYDSDEQVYEPGVDDNDGYYVPSQDDSDGSGRRIALYLAGAASISAICAAVYFMLPKGDDDSVQIADAGNNTAPSQPNITARDTTTTDAATTASSSTSADAPLNDQRVFSDLTASGTENSDTAISEPSSELFASIPKESETTTPTDSRTLSPNSTTLSSPDLKSAEITKPKVSEKAPSLTLSKPAAPIIAPPAAKTTPPEVTQPTTSAKVTAPTIAPKPAKPKLFGNSTSTAKTKQPLLSKILRPNTAKAIAPVSVSVGERVYDGVMRAGSMPQTIIDALFANGSYLAAKEQKQFAYNVRHAAKTTPDGEVNSIITQNGTRVDLHFLSTQNEVRPTFVSRADNIEPLPRYMLLKDDWVRVTTPTKLHAAPRQYDQTVLKNLPLSTTLERMGSVTDSSGEQWSMVGQNGIAIGYVPSLDLVSLSDTQTQTVSPFTTTVSQSVVERIDVSTPCRDYTISVGGTGSSHAACMTPDGDWMTKEGATSGLSFVNTPTPSMITSAPLASNELAYSSSNDTSRSALSEEAEAILFEPETLRRDARHGRGSASQRIGTLFSQTNTIKAVSISSPDGQTGQLSFDGKTANSETSAQTATPIALTTSLVKLEKQVRLMNAPGGTIVPNADTVMRGEVLEAVSVSTTPTGESWTLLGENGVGYGYVRTDYTSTISAYETDASMRYDGFNAATALGGTVNSASDVSGDEYQPPAPDCQTATYATGSETGILKACLQPNGLWTADVQPNTGYDIRSTAQMDFLQGGSNLW
ncbi:midas domain-containing protein [Hirschia baltica]|uniref:Uncharacterized protein n=1 Tax=Hirschia baltica (strain ATCC 49814 / DSM 5838 / IFAM 1418) TaxID=582402 RepID=C6XN31_HIRBI|nr:hypothetical protein [Hirschia baltica]ACT58201.1 hypothetical protein Hbal_0499 [Hirschia baltica ATCC 49814]